METGSSLGHAISFFMVLTSFLSITGCLDDSNRSPNFNVEVSAVVGGGAAIEMNYLFWGYRDSDGHVSNFFWVYCDENDFSASCPSLRIPFEADGEILIRGASDLGSLGSPGCFNGLNGSEVVIAIPSREQTVVLTLDRFQGGCS